MDDNNDTNSVGQTPGKVMDIHARRPQPSVRSVASPEPDTEELNPIIESNDSADHNLPGFEMTEVNEPEDTRATQPDNIQVDDDAVEQTEGQPVEQVDTPEPSDEPEPIDTQDTPEVEQENPLAIPPQPIKKHSTPIVALILSLVIALAIAALIVYVFSKKQSPATASPKVDTAASIPRVTPGDVDASIKKLDSNLTKLSDDQDFPSADTSTQTIGF